MSWSGWTLFPEGGGAHPGGTRGAPTACSIPQSEQFSHSQTLDRGFLLQKIQYKSDKIKAIFTGEVESELPTGNWALGLRHFCCSLGPVWV